MGRFLTLIIDVWNTPAMISVLTTFLLAALALDVDPIDVALVAAHNRERAAQNLPALILEKRLTEAAREHASDMAAHVKMSHDGSDGSTPADRVKHNGYHYLSTGENVAEGQESVAAVMTAWMNSPHHRENILGDFNEIGVARVVAEDGTPYWCVDFGRPYPKLDPSRSEADLADRLNKARAVAEKPVLRIDPRLAAAARAIASDLAAKDSVKPGGPAPIDRIKASGYRYSTISQSGSSGAPTPDEVLKSLRGSPEQEAIILGDFADLGVGYARDPHDRPFWCLLLAKPRP